MIAGGTNADCPTLVLRHPPICMCAAYMAETNAKWGGRRAMNARAHWRQRFAAEGGVLPCRRCGRPIIDGLHPWDVGHIVDRWAGGGDGLTNTWPEHSSCNRKAGGKRGAAVTNGRTQGQSKAAGLLPSRERGIRGI